MIRSDQMQKKPKSKTKPKQELEQPMRTIKKMNMKTVITLAQFAMCCLVCKMYSDHVSPLETHPMNAAAQENY